MKRTLSQSVDHLLGNFFFLFFIISFMLPSLSAQETVVVGEGKFTAPGDATSSYVKNHLKREAFQDVITKALQEMQLDSKQFWEQYEAKFQNYFGSLAQEKSRPSNKEKEEAKSWEAKKLDERIKFMEISGLIRVISSYSIKDMTRSSSNPNLRYLTLEANVNRALLNKIYHNHLGSQKGRKLEKIYLSSDYILTKNDWSLVGVQNKEQLSEVVEEAWKKWLDQKLGIPFGGAVVGRSELENLIFEQGPVLLSAGNFAPKKVVAGEEKVDETISASHTEDLSDSLWLKITVYIKQIHDDPLLKRREFSFSMDLLLVDLKTKQPLYFEEIKTPHYHYFYSDTHALSSQVAGLIYRLPLMNFGQMKNIFKELPRRTKIQEIEVKNYQNVHHLFQLQELVNLKGSGLQAITRIDSLGSEKATLGLWYEGSAENFQTFFLGLENLAVGGKDTGVTLLIPNREVPYHVQFQFLPRGGARGDEVEQTQDPLGRNSI